LHQAAKLHGAGEIGRRDDDIRKDHRSLCVALCEESQLLLPLHQRIPVADNRAEARQVMLAFGRFAAERGDLLGILARAHQIEAEIRLEALLLEIQGYERLADQMGQYSADGGVDQRRPNEISGNVEVGAEKGKRCVRRQRPKNDDERAERDHGVEHADADCQRVLHKQLQIVGDALVGVIGGVAEKLHAVMIGRREPLTQIGSRHPAPPANLQPLIQIELIDGEHGVDGRKHAEEQNRADEGFPVSVLQRVVETIVPLIENDLDADERQLDGDDRGEEYAPRPTVIGAEVRNGESPNIGDRQGKAFHE
jgi:hypothetical protein